VHGGKKKVREPKISAIIHRHQIYVQMYAYINVSFYVDSGKICGNFNFHRKCLQFWGIGMYLRMYVHVQVSIAGRVDELFF
jgi:hypothetical protein